MRRSWTEVFLEAAVITPIAAIIAIIVALWGPGVSPGLRAGGGLKRFVPPT